MLLSSALTGRYILSVSEASCPNVKQHAHAHLTGLTTCAYACCASKGLRYEQAVSPAPFANLTRCLSTLLATYCLASPATPLHGGHASPVKAALLRVLLSTTFWALVGAINFSPCDQNMLNISLYISQGKHTSEISILHTTLKWEKRRKQHTVSLS